MEVNYTTTIIGIGRTAKRNKVFLRLDHFRPYAYVKFSDDVYERLNNGTLSPETLRSELYSWSPPGKKWATPKSVSLVNKLQLYMSDYSQVDDSVKESKKLYAKVEFTSKSRRRHFSNSYFDHMPYHSKNLRGSELHEHDIDPALQFMASRQIPSNGWVTSNARLVKNDKERISDCNYEFRGFIDQVWTCKKSSPPPSPLVMTMDIEVNSADNTFPQANVPENVVFQIACIFSSGGDVKRKVLLNLGPHPDENIMEHESDKEVGKTEIINFDNEIDLIIGYSELIKDSDPDIITGWNTMGFDYPYLISRAKFHGIWDEFLDQSVIASDIYGKDKVYNTSNFARSGNDTRAKAPTRSVIYVQSIGRIHLDLLPFTRKEHSTLPSYKLSYVAEKFLKNSRKDPLSAMDIFRCYRLNTSESLAVVGRYCVQDSVVTYQLFEKLQAWSGLCEMARTCGVSMESLYTRGEQSRTFSLVYRMCTSTGRVINVSNAPREAMASGVGKYSGADVLEPIPGLHHKVSMFDFASLYPTVMISYNIDYSTLLTQGQRDRLSSDCYSTHKWIDSKTGQSREFHYLKKEHSAGVIPTLLKGLLKARNDVRKIDIPRVKKQRNEYMSNLETCSDPIMRSSLEKEISNCNTLLDVLNKRQLSYKISANAMYGSMGAKFAKLPLMAGAMTITRLGRLSLEKAKSIMEDKFSGKVVYGDTDSVMVVFPNVETTQDLWNLSLDVEKEIVDAFPAPMKLEFEGKLYWKFFSLTKKRYMAIVATDKGVEDKMLTKGVSLTRRDYSGFYKRIYQLTIDLIMSGKSLDETISRIYEETSLLYTNQIPMDEYILSNSVKPRHMYKNPDTQYTLNLVERLKNRGEVVDGSGRINLLFVDAGPSTHEKKDTRIEDPDFLKKYREYLSPDKSYYITSLTKQIQQMLEVTYGERAVDKYTDYAKARVYYSKVLCQLRDAANLEYGCAKKLLGVCNKPDHSRCKSIFRKGYARYLRERSKLIESLQDVSYILEDDTRNVVSRASTRELLCMYAIRERESRTSALRNKFIFDSQGRAISKRSGRKLDSFDVMILKSKRLGYVL